MKTTLRLFAIAVLALSIPACTTSKKAGCCSATACSTGACSTQVHAAKKPAN